VRAGTPIPVVAFPSEHLSQDERDAVLAMLGPRTGDPRKRADAVDRTDHLRLAPVALDQLRVRLIWADPWLDDMNAATRFGAGVTNYAPLDADFHWETYVVGSRSMFYGVAPKDIDAQRSRIEATLADAQRKHATIVVLPELCLTRGLLDDLVQRGAFDDFPLVVAGSYHQAVEANAPGANVCAVFANGMHVFSHHKFSDFYLGACHEHLVREDGAAGFDVLISPRCTVVVLICKDALGEVGDLVQALAPTLLLIPAMSEETVDFELLARRLAHDPQGFTLVACAGPKVNAIFGRPSLRSPVITNVSKAGGCMVCTLDGQSWPVKYA
jgi:predicted amidohydrolase